MKLNSDAFNPAQNEAIEKSWDLLTEHFDGVVIIIRSDDATMADGSTDNESRAAYYHGGYSSAIGMVRLAEKWLLHDHPDSE